MEPAPEGMQRFIVKSKFGMGHDLEILDENEQRVCFVDGKWGIRPAAEVQDASGTVLYKLRGNMMGIPKKLTLMDSSDAEIATIKAKFSPIKNVMDLEAVDGRHWHLEGNIIQNEYTVTSEDRTIIHVSQKWMALRDTYTMDVDESVAVERAAAFIWGVYAFREQR